jgi:hypothetical protein
MAGICRLCNIEADLQVSHFIPKFVGKWVKKTSITGYIREHNDVSKRTQDIAKEPWLCSKCEGVFSAWETSFANRIFYPFLEGGSSVASYDAWMSRFCASLSWRTLTYIRSKNDRKDKDEQYNHAVDRAEKHLSEFLLGTRDNLDQYEQHLYPLEKIESTDVEGMPANINRYILRTMAMDIVGNSSNLLIYTKLPCFILLGLVHSDESTKMRSSRIALGSSKISPRSYYWPTGLYEYISDKARESAEAHDRIPENDHKKIDDFAKRNPDKVLKSKLFEAWHSDYERFGDDVFK